jgi:transcriptional regulator with XRE-family HTH domain
MNATSVYAPTTDPIPHTVAWSTNLGDTPAALTNGVLVALPPAPDRCLHRLGEARQHEGLAQRVVARRLGISVQEVREQEQPSSDIRLSELYRWQEAIGTPLVELLIEPDGALSPPVQLRARMLRVMKTVRSIQERARQASVRRLVERLVDQLVEIMPELKDCGAWPAVGHRRSLHELGQAFFRGLSLDAIDEPEWQTEEQTP